MKYKLLAVDLDGTLFTSEQEIERETVTTLHEFRKRGGQVAICSGRSPLSTRWIAETIGLTDPIIAYNGAVTQTVAGEVFEQTAFRKEGLLAFIEACREYGVYGHLYEGDELLVPEKNEINLRWVESNIPTLERSGGTKEGCKLYRGLCDVRHVEILDEYVTMNEKAILKLAAFPRDGSRYHEFIRHLQSMKGDFEVSSSFSFANLEISPSGVSKASALMKLARKLGIGMHKVAAIGDNHNDLYMLEAAGFGIAMGNAPEEVKAAANAVTDTNDNLGVAKAVRRFILE